MNKISSPILKYKASILVLFTACFFIFGLFALNFKIDASAETLLTKDNAKYLQTQLTNQKFNTTEFILVAYEPRSSDIFNEKTFNQIETLAKQFKQIERVVTVNSMLSVPLITSREQLTNSDDVASLNYENQRYSPSQMRELLSQHPIFTDLLVNSQGSSTAIQLVFEQNTELKTLSDEILELQMRRQTEELTGAQNQRLQELNQQAKLIEEEIGKQRLKEVQQIESIIRSNVEDANVYIGGSYLVGIRLVEIVKQDLIYFGIGITILICIMLFALFRSMKWVVFPVFACSASVVVTLGILAALNIPATVISANFVALQIILTLAIMLHLITCYREISTKSPELKQHERIKLTLNKKLAPCFYAAMTTSIGFGSLIFSGIQPVIDFGIMMLVSNAVTLFVALFVFPSALGLLRANKETPEHEFFKTILNKIKILVSRQTKPSFLVPIVMLSIVSVGITKLTVENSFIDYFDDDTQIYQELSFIDKEFGGSTPLDVVVNTSNDSDLTFLDAEQVNTLHLAHATIDAFEATGNVTSLINFTTLAKQLNDNRPLTEYELDVIYQLVDEELLDTLIGAYVDVESNTMRISTRIEDTLPDLNRAELLQNINVDLQAVGFDESQYQLTGLFILYQDILSRLFQSQIATLGIVYLAIGLVLFAIFRSVKIAMIALLPNVISTTAILGLIGWLGIPLDLMTITIAAIAMGIAIDDTIHFTDAFLVADKGDEMNNAYSHTGLAVTFTSILIAAGFSMFMFSDFMPSVYFGLLTACAMLFALVTDLTLLPALLKTFVTGKNKES